MTKTKLVVLVGSYFAAAFVGYRVSSAVSKISTSPLNLSNYSVQGDVVNAEGSWKKVGGQDMVVPEPNTAKIRCDTHTNECTDEEAQVEDHDGDRYLRLIEVKYHVISWENEILLAQELNAFGEAPKDHDITLRISVKDKVVTRTSHGKKLKLFGEDLDLSNEWLEETLR